jgi:hypothetical protein
MGFEESAIKAINLLTINPESRLKKEVQKLTEKQDEISLIKLKHEKEMQQMDQKKSCQ